MLDGGDGLDLRPLRLGQCGAGLRRLVHFLHRLGAGRVVVEQRFGEHQPGIELEGLSQEHEGLVLVSREEPVDRLDVGVGGFRRRSRDCDDALGLGGLRGDRSRCQSRLRSRRCSRGSGLFLLCLDRLLVRAGDEGRHGTEPDQFPFHVDSPLRGERARAGLSIFQADPLFRYGPSAPALAACKGWCVTVQALTRPSAASRRRRNRSSPGSSSPAANRGTRRSGRAPRVSRTGRWARSPSRHRPGIARASFPSRP